MADKITALYGIEMTEFETAFLCGILKKVKPKKIVEVGVAEGGTSSIILQALEDIGQEYQLHSIDFATKCGYGRGKDDIAYISKYMKENNLIATSSGTGKFCGKHFEYYGTILPLVIDEIGEDIDLVILDTMHVLPGEILDFLAVLPYLSKNAFVVMHDVFWHQIYRPLCHATGTLFSSVVADKFLNLLPDYGDLVYRYPNIAAFQINEQTLPNIGNVFLALALRWSYFPPRNQLRAYREIIQKNYPPELSEMLTELVKANYLNIRIDYEVRKSSSGGKR